MPYTLLKADCIDLKLKIYNMSFWCDKLSDIEVPSGMVMAGGSTAILTNSSGVTLYRYDSNSNAWREDNNGFNPT